MLWVAREEMKGFEEGGVDAILAYFLEACPRRPHHQNNFDSHCHHLDVPGRWPWVRDELEGVGHMLVRYQTRSSIGFGQYEVLLTEKGWRDS